MLPKYFWMCDLPLACSLLGLHSGKTALFSQQLSPANGLMTRGGIMCPTALPMLAFGLAWAYTCFVHPAHCINWEVDLCCRCHL